MASEHILVRCPECGMWEWRPGECEVIAVLAYIASRKGTLDDPAVEDADADEDEDEEV